MPLLKVGDVIELKKGHTVYADIPEHCVYRNKIGCFEPTHALVKVGEDNGGLNTDFMIGQWIVVKTCEDGGGRGHNDIYSDGHHVFCEKALGKETNDKYDYVMKADFYQTGSFTAMIRENEIKAIDHIPFEVKIILTRGALKDAVKTR